MDMDGKLKDLCARRQKVMEGGGQRRTDRQHAAGKLTARERVALLLDEGSFVELDPFVTHRATDFGMDGIDAPGEGVVTGFGTIDGRRVCVASQDFTVIGGSLGEMHAQKMLKVMDMAGKMGVPFVGINDSGGARIQEGVDALRGYGEIFCKNTQLSGVVPQISVIMGPCAGGAVYSPALTDFVFMTKGANMFITGPQVIKAVTGEEVTSEDLGGAYIHNQLSGVAHFVSDTEQECLALVRRLLGYLPANNMEDPPTGATGGKAAFPPQHLKQIIPADPNRPYDIYDVIESVLDEDSFLDVHSLFAMNIVTGFGKLDGRPVGVVANQPKVKAGCLDIDASDKAARFIRFCDAFNIPLLTLVDVSAYLPGVMQEHAGIIRHGAKLLYAYSEATVPKITVILRKAYGGAYIAMCSKHLGADIVYALPTAEIAVMGPEGAANIIFRNEIADAQNPAEARKQKIAEFKQKFANPYVAASRGFVDDVIDPAQTRNKVISALVMCNTKTEKRLAKKHGNLPL